MLFIGRKAVKTVDKKWNNRLEKLSKKFNKKTIFIIPFLTFFYIAFIPLPNDIMIAFLAIIDYPFKKVAIPIVLGDYTFTILVSILASQGILLF
jgi:membrane protein YqaA with SNARE-associated domain